MFDIAEELKKLPQRPGVYLMKDARDTIIYVGKAINLKNRVRQYFQSGKNQTRKVQTMVGHIQEFEYIVTDTEMEALILECTLIKKHSPHYNIMLKDDKSYPYIKITVQEAFPRIFMTRHVEKDKAKYIGPITDAGAVKETIALIHSIWPIRKCNRRLPQDIGRDRPCLNHHIGQCKAPCAGAISQEEYRAWVEEAMRLLEGKYDEIKIRLSKEMQTASDAMEFERAAALRDQIRSIESIAKKQKMANDALGDTDVIALAREEDRGIAQIFFVRQGKLSGREQFTLQAGAEDGNREVMTEFVKQFYSGTAFVPRELLLQEALLEEEAGLIEDFLSQKRGSRVHLVTPQKGEKHKLVELAQKNAALTLWQAGERMKQEEKRTKGAVLELREALGLSQEVRRIEAYDISNTQGVQSVGSMVVFVDGKPKRSDYRKFQIKTVMGANDPASMEEMLFRRFRHALEERAKQPEGTQGRFSTLPDLILMDGGKAQVHAAQRALAHFGIHIPVCGMVKDDRHRTRGLLFEEKEVLLPKSAQGFLLLTRIQDEVHRFAIEYHRKLRDQKNLRSVLDEIPKVGPARRKALLRHFGSVENIQKADVEALLEVPNMTIQAAESVVGFFQREGLPEEGA